MNRTIRDLSSEDIAASQDTCYTVSRIDWLTQFVVTSYFSSLLRQFTLSNRVIAEV